MGQRSKVTTRTETTFRSDDRMDTFVKQPSEEIDDSLPHTRKPFHKRIESSYQHRTDSGCWQLFTSTCSMAPYEILLNCLDFIVRNSFLDEFTETSINSVDRFTSF
ncbi:hypothetical protein SAMN05216564_1073 [Halopenitus persicus]|uniref:Uncharacterized protein n=1 Tax=Halopenitus persicus TaxID=1048396 RepID=A0A1H3LBT9_9EURY|nr:hypothetical protein SAMN05216564_1073 [Halopenitus persicus]